MKSLIVLLLILTMPMAAFAASVGDERAFWVWDLSQMPPVDVQINATCRGSGTVADVYVENDAWDAGEMDNDDITTILAAFESQTPAGSYDENMGIYDIETTLFGPTTDVDSDGRMILLYYNLQCFEGTCFDGFFRSEDLGTGSHSNQAEMIHLNISNYNPSSDYILGIISHEFNHLIQYASDPMEETWASESFAEAAMTACGYFTDSDWLDYYLANSDDTFFGDEYSTNYGAALLLGTYLYETIGPENMIDVIGNTADGINGIGSALMAELGISFEEFFGELGLAILLDSVDGDIRFETMDFIQPTPAYSLTSADAQQEATIGAGVIHFVSLPWFASEPALFNVHFEQTKAQSDLLAWAVIQDATGYTTYSIDPMDAEGIDSDVSGTQANLVIVNPSPAQAVTYTITTTYLGPTPEEENDDDDDDDDDTSDEASAKSDDDDGGCGC